MSEIIIRHVLPQDLDECFIVETSGFPPEEAATRETIRLRMETFADGFLVAERQGRVVEMLHSAATDKDDLSDEELNQLVGHDPHGRNMVVFALAVLPEFQKQGIARQLVNRFVEEAQMNKILLLILIVQCNFHTSARPQDLAIVIPFRIHRFRGPVNSIPQRRLRTRPGLRYLCPE